MNISGRIKVKSLKKEFNAEFGLVIRVYDGNKFADDDATIASLRKGGEIKGEFSPQKNMKVGSFEDRMKADFGLKIQIAGSDDSYLCSDNLTLSKALENDKKRIEKRSKQNNDSEDVNETKIRSTIERTKKKVLEPGPMKGKWEGKLVDSISSNENDQSNEDSEDWDIDSVTIREILFTNCAGISGQDVALSTSAFRPVADIDGIINYLNHIFSDDDANYLFKYKKYADGEIILYASTYLLRLGGDVFEDDIDEYRLNEIVELLDKNGNQKKILSIIENYSEEGTLTIGDLIENLLVQPGQTVNVECIDNGYGNSNYELIT